MRERFTKQYDGVVSELRDEPKAFKRQCFRDGWDAAIAALPDMVAPLVWAEEAKGYWFSYLGEGKDRRTYRVNFNNINGFHTASCGGWVAFEDDFQSAKAAANAHYVAQIISAFATQNGEG